MSEDHEVDAEQTAEEILLACDEEVQEVVKSTLRAARSNATGRGSITKDDVVEIIRNIVK